MVCVRLCECGGVIHSVWGVPMWWVRGVVHMQDDVCGTWCHAWCLSAHERTGPGSGVTCPSRWFRACLQRPCAQAWGRGLSGMALGLPSSPRSHIHPPRVHGLPPGQAVSQPQCGVSHGQLGPGWRASIPQCPGFSPSLAPFCLPNEKAPFWSRDKEKGFVFLQADASLCKLLYQGIFFSTSLLQRQCA